MEQYENARVITLAPSDSAGLKVFAATFDEAFGQYSQLKGRGRARRTARKAAKQTKRMTRINNKQERKVARKTNRASNKQIRVSGRIQKKAMKQDARLERKAKNKAAEDPEEVINDTVAPETSDDAGYSPAQENGSKDPQTSAPDTEEGAEMDPADQGSEDAPDADSEEGGEDGEDSGFNGEESMSAFNSEVTELANTPSKIDPKVLDLVRKIEWNKQLLSFLERQIGTGGNDQEIQAHIDAKKTRIADLQKEVADSFSNARGGKMSKADHRAAKKEIHAAGRVAKKEMASQKAKVAGGRRSRVAPAQQAPASSQVPDETTDEADSSFNGGLGAYGEYNGPDAETPATRIVKVNAEGASEFAGPALPKSNTGKILIGVGVAVLLIYAGRQAKIW